MHSIKGEQENCRNYPTSLSSGLQLYTKMSNFAVVGCLLLLAPFCHSLCIPEPLASNGSSSHGDGQALPHAVIAEEAVVGVVNASAGERDKRNGEGQEEETDRESAGDAIIKSYEGEGRARNNRWTLVIFRPLIFTNMTDQKLFGRLSRNNSCNCPPLKLF